MDIISGQSPLSSSLSQCVYHHKPSCDVSSSHMYTSLIYLYVYKMQCDVYENGAKSITSGHAETYIVDASCSARVLRAVAEKCDYNNIAYRYNIYIYTFYIHEFIHIYTHNPHIHKHKYIHTHIICLYNMHVYNMCIVYSVTRSRRRWIKIFNR